MVSFTQAKLAFNNFQCSINLHPFLALLLKVKATFIPLMPQIVLLLGISGDQTLGQGFLASVLGFETEVRAV